MLRSVRTNKYNEYPNPKKAIVPRIAVSIPDTKRYTGSFDKGCSKRLATNHNAAHQCTEMKI